MINIFNLNRPRDETEIKKYTIYRKILERCHRRIELNSKKRLGHCMFTIPKITIGLPAYDQIKCAEYCVDKLKKNGFIVIYTYPNLLYISWGHVPSCIKNPDVKKMELEIQTNPYRDYSKVIYNLSTSNTKQIEYNPDNYH